MTVKKPKGTEGNTNISFVYVVFCNRCGLTGNDEDFENPMKGSGQNSVICPRCRESGWGGIETVTFIRLGDEWKRV